MKRFIAIVALTVAASSLGLAQTKDRKAAQKSKVEEEMTVLEHGWLDRLTEPGGKKLDRLLADEWTFIDPNGTVEYKAPFLAALRSGDLKYEAVDTDELKVRLYGRTAVVTGRRSLKGSFKQQGFDLRVRFTNVYVKRQCLWQLVAMQVTANNPVMNGPRAGQAPLEGEGCVDD